MIEVREITRDHAADIRLRNDPFPLYGRMLPAYADGQWSYTVERWPEEQCGEMRFPDEPYDYDAMAENSVFLGAYEDGRCIGLAVLQDSWRKYIYIYDLKVSAACRGQGVGRALMEAAKETAKARSYRGLYLQAQDNNLSACLFYVNTGFVLGGLDTRVYQGTSQEGKSDIIFYLELEG